MFREHRHSRTFNGEQVLNLESVSIEPGIDLTVILPAYNEESVVASSIARVDAFLSETGRSYEILVGDDGSRDRTAERAAATGHPAVRVIRRPHAGKGAILSACFAEARGRYTGFLDIDLEIDVQYLTIFLTHLDAGCDAVIADKSGGTENGHRRPLRRRILTAAYNRITRLVFGTPFRDHQGGMKFMRRELAQALMSLVRSPGWIWDTEVLVLAHRAGALVRQVPVHTKASPGRIAKVSWLTTSLAMAREMFILQRRIARKVPYVRLSTPQAHEVSTVNDV
jgi:hypothetical protein